MTIYDLQKKPHPYRYFEGRDYQAIPDRFLRNCSKALDYLYKTNALTITYLDQDTTETVDIIDILIADTQNDIKIMYSEGKNFYDPVANTIGFYDTHGLVFRKNHKKKWFLKNKGYNSPMAVLAHELIHCYNELYETEAYLKRKSDQSSKGKKLDHLGRDLSFPNKEEEFVIQMTNQVVKRLQEDKRSNYGRSYYKVADVCGVRKHRKNKRGILSKIFEES